MTPRFKGVPRFDLSLPCPLCGYKIQPSELVRLAAHLIRCPQCSGIFDQLGKKKPQSTS
jgi:DNA-directed RNA polymerase subunit RPC12/RpoP